jgi:predicted Zn-dependent protease
VIAAGIDPRGMQAFFEELAAEEHEAGGGDPVSAWFADHPGTGDRIAEIERMLAAVPPEQLARLGADDAGYQRMRARLAALPPPPPPPAGPPGR